MAELLGLRRVRQVGLETLVAAVEAADFLGSLENIQLVLVLEIVVVGLVLNCILRLEKFKKQVTEVQVQEDLGPNNILEQLGHLVGRVLVQERSEGREKTVIQIECAVADTKAEEATGRGTHTAEAARRLCHTRRS